MNWEHLFDLAETLAGGPARSETRGRPQQTHLRKATSTAYYAIFHTLANSNADTLIGSTATTRRSEEWTGAQRALNHGEAKTRMSNKKQIATFHDGIRDFAGTFVALQAQRHEADYNSNLAAPLTRRQTLRSIRRARDAARAFMAAPAPERRRFAAYLLFTQRN